MDAKEYYCKENSIKPENLSAEDDEIIWMLKEYHQSQSPQPSEGEITKMVNKEYPLDKYCNDPCNTTKLQRAAFRDGARAIKELNQQR